MKRGIIAFIVKGLQVMQKQPDILFLFCLVSFTLIGCATVPIKAYNGPDRPASETIKISVEKKPFNLLNPYQGAIYITRIDQIKLGNDLNGCPCSVLVLPGKHKVGVKYAGPESQGLLGFIVSEGINKKFQKELVLNAEPGQKYKIMFDVDFSSMWVWSRNVVYWIENELTGDIVSVEGPLTLESKKYKPKK